MEAIEVVGIENLSEQEKTDANKILNEYYLRIQREVKNILSLRVNVKEYNQAGKRKKYSMQAEAILPSRIYEAHAHDWDFARTLHMLMNKLMAEFEHQMHSSDQHPSLRKSKILKNLKKTWDII